MASKRIGALWVRTTQDGKQYFSGVLNDLRGDINIAIFQNDRKEKENQPDYNIILSEPKGQNQQNQVSAFQPAPIQPVPIKPLSDSEIPVIEDGKPMAQPEGDDIDIANIPF